MKGVVDLLDRELAKGIVDHAISLGASEAELYCRNVKRLGIEVKDQKIEALESSFSFGYAIRLIRENKIGFSYSTDIGAIKSVLQNALEASRYSEPDENICLPLSKMPQKVEIFDKKIESITEKDAVEYIMMMELAAFNLDSKIKKTRKVSGSFSVSSTYIVNSHGMMVDYSATSCSAQIMAIAEDGKDSQMGWYYSGSRFLDEIDFKKVGEEAAKRASFLLNAKKIYPSKGFILFDGLIVVDFLSLLANSLSSEAVQKGKSLLANKISNQVLSEKLNVIDNGVMNYKLGSRPVDDEGVPTQHKVLIEKGVLKTFLYNTYTAKKDKVFSTGNAFRGGYTNLPSIAPSNLFIESAIGSETYTFDELLKTVDKGIYVLETMGMHTANPISGDFSIGVSGIWIEKGELKNPVKEAVISGNLLELFRKIVMIGNDLKFFGNLGAPSLLIEDVDISG